MEEALAPRACEFDTGVLSSTQLNVVLRHQRRVATARRQAAIVPPLMSDRRRIIVIKLGGHGVSRRSPQHKGELQESGCREAFFCIFETNIVGISGPRTFPEWQPSSCTDHSLVTQSLRCKTATHAAMLT